MYSGPADVREADSGRRLCLTKPISEGISEREKGDLQRGIAVFSSPSLRQSRMKVNREKKLVLELVGGGKMEENGPLSSRKRFKTLQFLITR